MRITRQKIEGLDLIVVDNCFPKKEIREFYDFFSTASNWHKERGDEESNIWHLAADFKVSEIKNVDPFHKMQTLAKTLFSLEKLVPYRAYCNLTKYGDQANAHQDSNYGTNDVTSLYYANPQWQQNWGGETLFYDKRNDTAAAINPRPGRIVFFRGELLHRNGVPCRAAPVERYSVALKFSQKRKQK